VKRSTVAVVAVGLAVAGWWATVSLAGPTITLGRIVPASQQVAVNNIDHSIWSSLLDRYVDSNGMVDYRRWKASSADQQSLEAYLQRLSAASFPATATREARLAFWINAYNAVTVEGILREYPTTSIRNHTAKIVGYNIWDDLQLLVGGRPYSLNAIEHEVLRRIGEPRIHFAIVCASIGCPRLLNEAYTAARLDEQLTLNTRAFFADSTKFRADTKTNSIHVSPILNWFAKDFGDSTAAQMKTISPYVPTEFQSLTSSGQASVKYLDYDWGLNDQAKVRNAAPR